MFAYSIKRAALFGMLLMLVAGCSTNHVPPPSTHTTSAVPVLTQMLESWKSGLSADTLKSQVPSIHAIDDDWRAGRQLISFAIEEIPETGGVAARLSATLQLSGPSGPYMQTAQYLVRTTPVISVVRFDDAE